MKRHWLETILNELHQESYHWARQCCSFDEDEAKDLLQLVYLKILEGKAIYSEKSLIKTWLFAVIRYTASEERKKKLDNTPLDQINDLAYKEDEPEGPDFHKSMMLQLPDRQKEVLLLVFYHSMTVEKAAEIMEVSIGTARTHYDRGKKKLKDLIEKTRIEK